MSGDTKQIGLLYERVQMLLRERWGTHTKLLMKAAKTPNQQLYASLFNLTAFTADVGDIVRILTDIVDKPESVKTYVGVMGTMATMNMSYDVFNRNTPLTPLQKRYRVHLEKRAKAVQDWNQFADELKDLLRRFETDTSEDTDVFTDML